MNLSSDPINTLENLIAKNKTKSISIYLVVVLAIAVFIALLPIIKIDISSQSRGVIRSKIDNVPVMAVVSGRIADINIYNNSRVNRGDTLIKIVQDNLLAEKQLNDTIYATNADILADLNNVLLGKQTLKTPLIRESFYKFNTQKAELQSKVAQSQINYQRYKTLFEKEVIAKAEFEKYQFEYQFAKQALNSFIKQQMAAWQNQKNELVLQLQNLEGNNNKLDVEAQNYYVIAPSSGTIENFIGLQAGSSINAAQAIAYISPNEQLIVENTVSPTDIGLIKIGQTVKFQLDAFNYNQWGLLTGKVIDIDQNITLQDNQAFFRVRCALDKHSLQLKSGYETQVSKGMTLTSRFMITERSLFDLLFDKVDDWLNPKIQ